MKRQLQLLTIGLLLAAGGVNCAWAGDFIDDATKIEITNNSATTDVTSSVTTVDGKKQFSFTPSAAGEFQMKFTFSSGYTLNASQAFIVLEMSNNLVTDNNPNRKVRNLTIDNNSYELLPDERSRKDPEVQDAGRRSQRAWAGIRGK